MYMNLITGRNTPDFAKDTMYRFMKMVQINWICFTTILSFLLLSDYTLSSFYSFTTLTILSSILPFLNQPALYTHFLLKMIYCFLLLFHSHLICYEVPQL